MTIAATNTWIRQRIPVEQKVKYLANGREFIDDAAIERTLDAGVSPDPLRVRAILQKSLAVQTLSPEETATLIAVTDPSLRAEMEDTALAIKKKVYDNRIVTFAPLYMSTRCVNNCRYCGLRSENTVMKRGVLTQEQVRAETEVLAGGIGHKRLIAVYGEHPSSDADYIARTIETIYSVRMKTKNGTGSIRRVNVNAAPMTVENLKMLHDTGIGTYQVFQETYHHDTYRAMHPQNTVKGDYQWRIYSMHRALEAGIDDVGIGALFGLYDWKFEVMGLLLHAIELETRFGIGPHTISFPRIEPAESTPLSVSLPRRVGDDEFRRAVTVLRLAVPYTGMILTARESAPLRDSLLGLGITQMDASSNVGLGAYSDTNKDQQPDRQQFILGDTRTLDELIHDLADRDYITSFCTAGYRCGRTGKCIMDLLRTGQEGKFCKLNAVITYREWLDDFASEPTRIAGEKVIEREIAEVRVKMPKVFEAFMENYNRTKKGERDLFF
jgi:2-iminoacetate synthase